MFALVEASGFVGADGALQSQFSEPVFESFLQLAFASRVTTAARGFRIALIAADENMLLEFRHEDSLRDEAWAKCRAPLDRTAEGGCPYMFFS